MSCPTRPLIAALQRLRARAVSMEAEFAPELAAIGPAHRESARNLLHYLALRQSDIRALQEGLGALGLSRLARCEAHVLSSIDAVLEALHALEGSAGPVLAGRGVEIEVGTRLLQVHARDLLGERPARRPTRIMVTMPSEAAADADLVEALCAAGMDVMRINCAHDDAHAWLCMIDHCRAAERKLGRRCYAYADLAGPKLRTGALASADRVVSFAPRRDIRGMVTQPARVWLTPRTGIVEPAEAVDALLPVDETLLAEAEPGDVLQVADTRGSRRNLTLMRHAHGGWLAESTTHVYVADGADCALTRHGVEHMHGRVGPLPEVVLPLVLRVGETLQLTADPRPGRPAQVDAGGKVLAPASIPITLPEIFAAAHPGQPIWFDDGKIGGVIRTVQRDVLSVEITHPAATAPSCAPRRASTCRTRTSSSRR